VGGAAIVMGAGGRATDLDGQPVDGTTGRVLATNGLIHDEISRVLEGVARRENAPWP
jgi:myo-inositol-1(or 4)-monophosphatase